MEPVKRDVSNDLYEWLRIEGHVYSILHSLGVGGQNFKVAFSHKDCKYYVAPEVELSDEKFASIARYLRWEFDKIEEIQEEVEVEVEAKTKSGNSTVKKVKELRGTGQFRNSFPATTQNIIKKRNELKSELMDSKADVDPADFKSINIRTVPHLVDHERIEKVKRDQGYTAIERMARSIEATTN